MSGTTETPRDAAADDLVRLAGGQQALADRPRCFLKTDLDRRSAARHAIDAGVSAICQLAAR